MSNEPLGSAATGPMRRRPLFAFASSAFGMVTLMTLLWPGGADGSRMIGDALRDLSLAQLFLGLLVWGVLVMVLYAVSLLLLIPSVWRKERPLHWIALAIMLQLIIAVILW